MDKVGAALGVAVALATAQAGMEAGVDLEAPVGVAADVLSDTYDRYGTAPSVRANMIHWRQMIFCFLTIRTGINIDTNLVNEPISMTNPIQNDLIRMKVGTCYSTY